MQATTTLPVSSLYGNGTAIAQADRTEIGAAVERQRQALAAGTHELPTSTVPRERYVKMQQARDMYQRLYNQDRIALVAEKQTTYRLSQHATNLAGALIAVTEAHRTGQTVELLIQVLKAQALLRSMGFDPESPSSATVQV